MASTYFNGLPQPYRLGLTAVDIAQALRLSRGQRQVQLITSYPLEGNPSKYCSINMKLFELLLNEGGLEHSSEDVLAEELADGATECFGGANVPSQLLEEGRLRYDFYEFTEYGNDVLEYYHLLLLGHEDEAQQVLGEGKPVRFTKAHLFQSANDLGEAPDANVLMESALRGGSRRVAAGRFGSYSVIFLK